MAEQIGMDPVELDALVQRFVDANRASYDALLPEAKSEFTKALRGQMETVFEMLERERRKTLDHVLQIMNVVDRIEKSPILRAAIIKFRDEI